MRWWLGAAARLYPKAWRKRYGVEFACLLDGVKPRWTDVLDVLRGAAMMQLRTWSSYLKLVGAVAVAGVMVALVVSFILPGLYVSSAVVHAGGADDPQTWVRIQRIWQEVTSRSSLSELIQRPRLDLYKGERNRRPLEDVIEDMKAKDLKLEIPNRQGDVGDVKLHVSFAYPDPRKAQAVVNALTLKVMDAERQLSAASPRWMVAPANLPLHPLGPNRLAFAAWGLVAGLLAGVIASFFRWRAAWTLKVAGFGLAGCGIVGGLSLLIPNQYTSRCMFLVTLTPKAADGAPRFMRESEMAEWLRKKELDILSNESLAEIIHRPSLDLYHKQREDQPFEAVMATMRQNLKVEVPRGTGAFTISFTYPDRFKAQSVVSALVNKFIDSEVIETEADLMAYHSPSAKIDGGDSSTRIAAEDCIGATGDRYVSCITSYLAQAFPPAPEPPKRHAPESLELLDPASLPATPIAPNRLTLALMGLFAGLFLGAFALRSKSAVTLKRA